ncbi:MAG: hypothetical protein ACXWID_02905, partial [Pyrinomonadaceae bacterium]
MLTAATFACQQLLTLTAAEFKREFKTKILRGSSVKRQYAQEIMVISATRRRTPKSFTISSPGLRQRAALGNQQKHIATLEGLPKYSPTWSSSRTLSGSLRFLLCSPGRCPGLEFANVFGVCQSSRTDVRQVCYAVESLPCRPY